MPLGIQRSSCLNLTSITISIVERSDILQNVELVSNECGFHLSMKAIVMPFKPNLFDRSKLIIIVFVNQIILYCLCCSVCGRYS